MIDLSCWRLSPSEINPADIVSRGASPLDLCSDGLWFKGPSFLTLPESDWPNLKIGDNFTEFNLSKLEKIEPTNSVFYSESNNSDDYNPRLIAVLS